jgi:hypothetical protein
MDEQEIDLFEAVRPVLESEFYQEVYTRSLLVAIMRTYKPSIVKKWVATDLIEKDGKTLIHWKRRAIELTDEQFNSGHW